MSELHLALLGRPQITLGNTSLDEGIPSKAEALLYYLAVTGQPHSRLALAGLLWGDLPEEDARRNLRVALATLPRVLKPFLTIRRVTLAFNVASSYSLDVERFRARLQNAATAVEYNLEALREAVALYRGDFLEDFYVRDAPDFEEWVVWQRESLRQLVLDALHRLSVAAMHGGDYASGLLYTGRLLALDSWREEAHRQMMLLLALSGRRTSALAQYESCRRILAAELGVEPSRETTVLYERIKAEEVGATGEVQLDGESGAPGVEGLPATSPSKPHSDLTVTYRWIPPPALDEAALAGACAHLATLPLDAVPAPTPLPPRSRMLFRSNPFFVGREQDLRALAATLKEEPAVAIVAGLGGIGKTQLAVEFVHRYGSYFAGGIFWLSFANPDAIPSEIAMCGGPGHLDLRPDFSSLPLEDQVRLVLAAWQSPLPRLLVFDSCEDEAVLARWQPTTGGCRILATSRRALWDPTLNVRALALPVLKRADSISLLRRYCRDVADKEADLAALATELGDLPLALHLAGNFLGRYHHSVNAATYLKAVRDRDLLAHPSLRGQGLTYSPTGHVLDVARTFAISYERLDTATPTDAVALQILTLAAHFAPGVPIPRHLLLAALRLSMDTPVSPLRAEDGMRRLIELGLVDREEDGSCRLHGLLAAFVQASVPDSAAKRVVEQALLGIGSELNAAGYPAPLLAIQPHLRAVTDRALPQADELAAGLCDILGFHLQTVGDYQGAGSYFEYALKIRETTLGEAHVLTARSLNNMGWLLTEKGDYRGARPHLDRALAIREAVLGELHSETAESLNALGMLLKEQGEYTAARASLERALAIREATLGGNHPFTADSLNNLGIVLKIQQDYAGARATWERALSIWRAALGPRHPNIARSLNNLGLLAETQGDYSGARSYYEAALAIWEETLGPHHPNTAATLSNLGDLLKSQGEYKGAQTYLERALGIFERVLEPRHLNTAWTLNALGELAMDQGDVSAARRLFEEALAMFTTKLGATSPYTKAVHDNLAGLEAFFLQGRG